jgi:hypothetical protein
MDLLLDSVLPYISIQDYIAIPSASGIKDLLSVREETYAQAW